MTDKTKDQSIEQLIEEHIIRMRFIPGNPGYKFDISNIKMYLSRIESHARSPPVIMHKTYKKIRMGDVFGNDSQTNIRGRPNTDYGPEN